VTDAFYSKDDDLFHATALTSGPWDPRLQHGGPVSALMARAADDLFDERWQLTRITVDMLRPVPVAPLRTRATIVREGRKVCHAQISLTDAAGKELFSARSLHVRREQVPGALPPPTAPPRLPPEQCPVQVLPFPPDRVGYHTAMEVRRTTGRFRSGPVEAWFRMKVPLVAGTPTRGFERVLVATDAASGISPVLDWGVHTFVNADLHVCLQREPRGEWVGVDARTDLGPDGVGLTHAVLRDELGRLGHSVQDLILGQR
jgi:hypothetical protein